MKTMARFTRALLLCGMAIHHASGLAATENAESPQIVLTASREQASSLIDPHFDLSNQYPLKDPVQLSLLQQADATAIGASQTVGPMLPQTSEKPYESNSRYRSFGSQAWSVKWEYGALFAYITALHLGAAIRDGTHFKFQNEGFFGDSTPNLGIDKLTHAFNSQLITDILQWRIAKKTGDAPGSPLTAAILAMSLVAYGEFYDGLEPDSGFSWQDMSFNLGGAAISVLRQSIPGLKDKLDFRMLTMPNHEVYSFRGKEHFRQQRFLLALQLGGFKQFEHSPLRFVELHAGYYASGFTFRERAAGKPLDQRPFIGIGINLQQLFFRNPRSLPARVADRALDYIQIPYTAAHIH